MVNASLSFETGTKQGLPEPGNWGPQRRRPPASAARAVDYMYHPSFSSPAAEIELWGPQRPRIPVSRYRLQPEIDKEMPRSPMKRTPLSAGEEKTLFLQYNFAKFRLCKLQAREGSSSSGEVASQIATWEKRAQEMRAKIVHANLALVPAMAKRMDIPGVEFEDLISEGFMALLRSVEKFNVARRFKFSTYACRSILASFHRAAAKAQRRRKRFPVEFDPELDRSDFSERRHEEQRSDAIESVRELLLRNDADLSEVERTVVLERYPVLSGRERRTLAEIGKAIGVSNERVRQIEKESLEKIRTVLEEELFAQPAGQFGVRRRRFEGERR